MIDLSSLMSLSVGIGTITLGKIVSAILTLLVCMVAMRIVTKVLTRILGHSHLNDRVKKYAVSAIRLVLYILTAIIVISSLGIDMTSLVALLSVCSLGITLAAEDILGNVAGGLVILSSSPFSIGDLIEVNGTTGVVTQISLNHTKLTTADGQLVLLPNKALSSSKMVNYTALKHRRVTQKITASYDAPTETVKAACMEALAKTDLILDDPAPSVVLSNYGASSIEYSIFCWTLPENYLTVYFNLGEHLRETFAAHNVEMTYDHLNVHIVENKG